MKTYWVIVGDAGRLFVPVCHDSDLDSNNTAIFKDYSNAATKMWAWQDMYGKEGRQYYLVEVTLTKEETGEVT